MIMINMQSRSFCEGEEVVVKNYGRHGNQWLEGIIVTSSGPVSAVVELSDGNRMKRHFEQLRKRHGKSNKAAGDQVSALSEDFPELCRTRVGRNLRETPTTKVLLQNLNSTQAFRVPS